MAAVGGELPPFFCQFARSAVVVDAIVALFHVKQPASYFEWRTITRYLGALRRARLPSEWIRNTCR